MNEANGIYTSQFYDFQLRGTTNDFITVHMYTDRNRFSVKKEISFDNENQEITSLEYFSGSILSSILLTLLEYCKKQKLELLGLEGIAKTILANPLTLVGVRGYEEEPFIDEMKIKIYICLDMEEAVALKHCQKALAYSPIINTLKKSVKLEIDFKCMDY